MGFNWAFKGLKYTIISLLHVSVFNDHHQGALSVPGEGKSVPLKAWSGPEVFQEVKVPRFHDNGTGWW